MNEAAFRSLVSGERRGAWPSLLRGGLRIASCGYRAAVGMRNAAYDRGWLRTTDVGIPVVSVGNVTTGGTGKTPFVAWLVTWFAAAGLRPAILSRGYRSLDGQSNDERLVLDRLCPGIPHVQNPDRIAGAHIAIAQHGAQVLVLDDGFQHRRLARGLDIVLIDAIEPWGYGHLLPRGLLREPATAVRRAGVLVLTRSDQASAAARQSIVNRARALGATVPVVEASFVPATLVNAAGQSAPLSELSSSRVLAFCGIGNPTGFFRLVEGLEITVAGRETFPDHHHYTPADLDRLGQAARAASASALVTTEKDLVKIPQATVAERPVWAVRIAARITSGKDALELTLQQLLGSIPG